MGSGWLYTGISGFGTDKTYVVQTLPKVIQRCILMTTAPATWRWTPPATPAPPPTSWRSGRRWITIDTSRVALALARASIIGAR